MATDQKIVNLSFFRLVASAPSKRNESSDVEISKAMRQWTKAHHALPQLDGSLFLFRGLKIKGGVTAGTLVKSQMRDIPPGYDPTNGHVTDLGLTDKQGLSHFTCFVYDAESNVVMMETMRDSCSISALCGFIQMNVTNLISVDWAVVIDPDTIAEVRALDTIKKFQVKIARATNGEIFSSASMSLGELLGAAKGANSDYLDITLSTRKTEGTMDKKRIIKWVEDLLRLNGKKEVKSISVRGLLGEEEETSLATVNLINARMKASFLVKSERYVSEKTVEQRTASLLRLFAENKAKLHKAYKI